MFMFCDKEHLDELKNFKQEMADCCERAYAKRQKDLDFLRIDAELFAALANYIDYAVPN